MFGHSFAFCTGRGLTAKILPGSFRGHPAVAWRTRRRGSHGRIFSARSTRSTQRRRQECGTARSCFCSPRPVCATKRSGHSSFRISAGEPQKSLCGEPRGGYAFKKQAATLRAFVRQVESEQLGGPLTKGMALNFVLSFTGAANGRAIRHGVLRRFCEYLAVYDARTEALDRRALPRSRAIPPPRILSDEELASLIAACSQLSPTIPQRGRTLRTLVGLLASTGLRSGEALRLDRADVDLVGGVLQIRKTKFRKDRLVPVHATTLTALRQYARHRDTAFPVAKDCGFFSARMAIGCRRQGSILRLTRPASSPVSTLASL